MKQFILKLFLNYWFLSKNKRNKPRRHRGHGGRGGRFGLSLCVLLAVVPDVAMGVETHLASVPKFMRVVVNSNLDGAVAADDGVTLREAIAIVNGTLAVERLSEAEKAQVSSSDTPRIDFNLPAGKTEIALQEILPPLATPGLVVDGTTQPGYDGGKSATAEIAIAVPVVTVKPAELRNILRGFTVVADKVAIRGLSIYGFSSQHERTASIPPADIFIASSQEITETDKKNSSNSPISNSNSQLPTPNSSQNVVIENNWLGITPDGKMPGNPSAFGVSVFNAVGTIIRRNRISYHDGSAIITSVSAKNTQIQENIIIGNGLAGMPDAIRLEGSIGGSQITANLICANDGSGVFLFKPEGAVGIKDNQIKYNGRRLRRAAIYLMGSDNQVSNNEISNQAGPGVVVTAFPNGGSFQNGAAIGNAIQNNRFANLEGLSIDLNTKAHTDVQDFQRGDGRNPQRTSENRRLDTGNGAINTPEFVSKEFLLINNQVSINGKADPDSSVSIYRVGDDGGLSEAISTIKADDKGRFATVLDNLKAGEMVSAIASHPKYGTSEPAYDAVIQSPGSTLSARPKIQNREVPNCTTPPKPPIPPEPQPNPEPPTPPEAIRLRVPNNIHYALDKDFISPASGVILDKIIAVMKQYPTIVIELQGHTDARASDTYNRNLALRRAKNARNYMIKNGIAPERMKIRSFGEGQLKTPGRNRVEHAYNRRVEIMFFDTRGVEIIWETQEGDLQIER
jgi:outer membrane protein OmpA-like peptidoglycan-associated protein